VKVTDKRKIPSASRQGIIAGSESIFVTKEVYLVLAHRVGANNIQVAQ